MAGYSIREVEELLGVSEGVIRGLVRAGLVVPQRGKRGEYRFSFQDLIVLRTAQGLGAARVSAKRILRSLKRLQDELSGSVPLSGLRLSAVGDQVVVSEGDKCWRADSGQYLLDFESSQTQPCVAPIRRAADKLVPSASEWFETACQLEEVDPKRAAAAYRQAIALDSSHAGAYTNLGRLLHESGEFEEAENIYRQGIGHCGNDPLLLFNLGVLLEDRSRIEEAIGAYETALATQNDFADCHYNLALLYEARGRPQHAIQHLQDYRRLVQRPKR